MCTAGMKRGYHQCIGFINITPHWLDQQVTQPMSTLLMRVDLKMLSVLGFHPSTGKQGIGGAIFKGSFRQKWIHVKG